MSIDDSFYKNVFLLMQVVPASYQCAENFKKGMFRKPNTSGFIHISHYLLSVHNAKRFQRMVTWPILNKVDERNYRTEIKDYLGILAKENPDINFPSVLMSHLLQAGGIKFRIIMWKISVISLRAYIIRKCHITLLHAPDASDNNLAQIFFTNISIKKQIANFKLYERTMLILEYFDHYMQFKSIDLKKIQKNIFETKKNIEDLTHKAPVSPLIATRLKDIEDSIIIELWKKSIDQNIIFLNISNSKLKQHENLSKELCNLVTNLCLSTKVLDANKLPKVNVEILPVCFNNNMQVGLYTDGCLEFHVLLLTFDQLIKQVETYLKVDLPDLSVYEEQIQEYSKIIRNLKRIIQELVEQVYITLNDTQCNLEKKNVSSTLEVDFVYPVTLEVISHSPKLNFSTDEYICNENILEELWSPQLQGKYKYLFQRYKRNTSDLPKLPTVELHLNNSKDTKTMEYKSPQRQTLVYKTNSPNKTNVSTRYSRLFSASNSKKNYFNDNNATSTPKLTRLCGLSTKTSDSSGISSSATSKSSQSFT